MSAVPTVRAALMTLVQAALMAAGETTVELYYGPPGATFAADVMSVQAALAPDQTSAVLTTARPRDESFEVPVAVSCGIGGGPESQQTVTERAYALAALVEAAVRADPTLGGVAACRAVVARVEAVGEGIWWDERYEPPNPIGRLAEVGVLVACTVRI